MISRVERRAFKGRTITEFPPQTRTLKFGLVDSSGRVVKRNSYCVKFSYVQMWQMDWRYSPLYITISDKPFELATAVYLPFFLPNWIIEIGVPCLGKSKKKYTYEENKCKKSPTGIHRWSIAYKGFQSCIDCSARSLAYCCRIQVGAAKHQEDLHFRQENSLVLEQILILQQEKVCYNGQAHLYLLRSC